MLKRYAEESGCAVISAGYRLAPEDPFPKGNEDCVDVAEWLVDGGVGVEKVFGKGEGSKMKFLGGDSAGAHLSVCTAFSLLEVSKSTLTKRKWDKRDRGVGYDWTSRTIVF